MHSLIPQLCLRLTEIIYIDFVPDCLHGCPRQVIIHCLELEEERAIESSYIQ